MPNIDSNPRDIKLSIPGNRLYTKPAVLPRALSAGVRAAGAPKDPFVNPEVVVTEAEFDLTLAARGSATVEVEENLESNRVLALETEDGTTIFIRADRLQEELGRLYPDEKEKGILDIGALRDPEASSRGVSDWIWSRLSVLDLQPDAIIDTARRKAAEWAMELLGEQAKEKLLEIADFGASRLGAKALMWAIESRLADRPGLYRWRGPEFAPRDYMREEDPHLEAACREGPILVFIHGTGSNTWGSFGDLNTVNAKDWEKLSNGFGKRVYGFEHRTFSESPITNALALARVLPAGARFSVVTHSRGGLVGDLLCLSGLDEVLIQSYRRTPPANGEASDEAEIRELVTLKEQAQLRELRDLLSERNFRIDRYVRVACPARGTTLLSDNLELFLSSLLSLAGMVSGLATHPVYSALKRVVLEIAHHRVDPHLVPGIEAMMTDAPMAQLLSRVERKQGIEMAVIAGDIEGGGMLQRIGVMFTDWMFFNRIDNDLVVDTESMYAGLARAAKSRYLFIRHENASHFHYFDNALSRGALRDWLSEEHPDKLPDFSSLAGRGDLAAREGEVRMARRARGERPFNRNRPVVIVLPGITGSHLEKRKPNQRPGEGDRIWFDFLELALGGLAKISYR
ncbi:MAG: hypothetical protein U9Q71_06490, partial [Pseudomonadota bacterium]|nr:hypothetical protein [Pseudomonadota bacterium]